MFVGTLVQVEEESAQDVIAQIRNEPEGDGWDANQAGEF
jgi:hypothetical protein